MHQTTKVYLNILYIQMHSTMWEYFRQINNIPSKQNWFKYWPLRHSSIQIQSSGLTIDRMLKLWADEKVRRPRSCLVSGKLKTYCIIKTFVVTMWNTFNLEWQCWVTISLDNFYCSICKVTSATAKMLFLRLICNFLINFSKLNLESKIPWDYTHT